MSSSPATVSRRVLLAGAAGIAAGACSFGGRAPAPLPLSDTRRYPDATLPGLLVSPADAARALAHGSCDSPRLLDVRPIRDYRRTHIAGARHAWWQDTVERNLDWYGGVLRPDDDQGDQSRRRGVLDLWGLPTTRPVIVYDDHVSVEAARVAWFLTFLGFPSVSVLDGGYAGWLAERAASPEPSGAPESSPRCDGGPLSPRPGYYLLYEQVQTRLSEGNTVLLDVRTDAEVRDDVGGTVRPGTIPGALAWPHDQLLDADRRLLPAADLAARARSLGLEPPQRIVLVGRFATDCALSWLALQLIGLRDVPTYDGGWVDWSTRSDAPVSWLERPAWAGRRYG